MSHDFICYMGIIPASPNTLCRIELQLRVTVPCKVAYKLTFVWWVVNLFKTEHRLHSYGNSVWCFWLLYSVHGKRISDSNRVVSFTFLEPFCGDITHKNGHLRYFFGSANGSLKKKMNNSSAVRNQLARNITANAVNRDQLTVWFAVMLAIAVFGVISNALLIAIISRSPKLRSGTGILILNLLLTCLAMCTLNYPVHVLLVYGHDA